MWEYNDGSYLYHHGIKGQQWGVENGPPYPLDPRTSAKIQKRDMKWAKKNEKKITKEVREKSRSEIDSALSEIASKIAPYTSDGKLSRNFVNAYNQRLAEIMNSNIGNMPAPSGRVVRFVAKRASDGVGTYIAIADADYDMSQVKNGVYGTGRIGYKKTGVNVSTY